ncbi:ubiquitin-specific protease doa4 [Pichia californica]|nr:ubiquitin-specific protease doa4 [[Candida] californica]
MDFVFKSLNEKAQERLQNTSHNLNSKPVAITFIQNEIQRFLEIVEQISRTSYDAVGLDKIKEAYCNYVCARDLLDRHIKDNSDNMSNINNINNVISMNLIYLDDLNQLDKILNDNLWYFKNIKEYIAKSSTNSFQSNVQSRFNSLLNGGNQIIEKSKLIENTTNMTSLTPNLSKMNIIPPLQTPVHPPIIPTRPRILSPSPTPSDNPDISLLNIYAQRRFITVDDLMEIYRRFQDSVLLIDFRPRLKFEADHISFFTNIVNIDPISVKPTYIVQDVINSSLLLSSIKDIETFSKVSQYELVIIIDQSSIHAKVDQDTMRFVAILDEKNDDIQYKLKRKPLILDGGFDDWTYFMNNQNGPVFNQQRQQHQQQNQNQNQNQAPVSPIMHSSTLNTASPLSGNNILNSRKNYIHTKPYISRSPSPTGFNNTYSNNFSAFSNQNIVDQKLFPVGNLSTKPRSSSPVRPIYVPSIKPNNIQISAKNTFLTNLNNPLAQVSALSIPLRSQSPTKSPNIVSGLFNLGNSCYMNSSLQCLIGTKILTNYLLQDSYQQYVAKSSKLGSGGRLTNEYHNLAKLMLANTIKKVATNPRVFKKMVGSINSSFNNCDQQDSAEFLHFILDTIHEDLNFSSDKNALPAISDNDEANRETLSLRVASAIEWERYLKTDFSAVIDTFAGQYASRLECGICHKTSTTYIPYNMLSVPVPNLRKNLDLYDCINTFVSPEILTKDNAWKCPRCKKDVETKKQLTITRLPKILILHLERFSFVGSMIGGKFIKNSSIINIPLKLSMKKYWPQVQTEYEREQLRKFPSRGQEPGDWAYRLYGIVRHYGTLDGGHYIAEVMKEGRWIKFDDEKLKFSETMGKSPETDGSAYILFYEKIP